MKAHTLKHWMSCEEKKLHGTAEHLKKALDICDAALHNFDVFKVVFDL